jgi:hypothetical protein
MRMSLTDLSPYSQAYGTFLCCRYVNPMSIALGDAIALLFGWSFAQLGRSLDGGTDGLRQGLVILYGVNSIANAMMNSEYLFFSRRAILRKMTAGPVSESGPVI